MKKMIGIVLLSLLCVFALVGCREEDDHRNINKCLFQQEGDVIELRNRIKDLEWKVKALRAVEQKRMDTKIKEAKERLSEKKKCENGID